MEGTFSKEFGRWFVGSSINSPKGDRSHNFFDILQRNDHSEWIHKEISENA